MTEPSNTIRIATRRSPLARWQADHVADLLRQAHPGVEIEVVPLQTRADQRLDLAIADLGGKGAFAKEVQAAVLQQQADIAVHSAKDLQSVSPDGLTIGAFPPRGDPRDALVGSTVADLAPGAVVATGSNRRRVQLQALRPDLRFEGIRGNIATRLSQLGRFDAIVMAAAALERLGEEPDVVEILDTTTMVPQVGQGALAVECRIDDHRTRSMLSAIDHPRTRRVVSAERAFLAELGGDCELPAGAHAVVDEHDQVVLRAILAPDHTVHRFHDTGPDGVALGRRAAQVLRGHR